MYFKSLTAAIVLICAHDGSASPSTAPPKASANLNPIVTGQGEMLEAIVATVNEVPITLTDVIKRLPNARRLTLAEASKDIEFKQVLDSLIMEKLVEEESKAKHIDTSDAEIEEYVNEVAQRNNLDRTAFENALRTEGKSVADYKRQVRLEILKSKLLSQSVRGSVSVSDAEIETYLKENPESGSTAATIKLRQILVKTDGRTDEEARSKIEQAKSKVEDGDEFSEVAQEMSEAPDAPDGGLLGNVEEKDLSSEIFDAIFSLDTGDVSEIIKTANGYHIFMVEERAGATSDDDNDDTKVEARREVARKALMDRKAQEKMSSFFVHDLYQAHSVDKKI